MLRTVDAEVGTIERPARSLINFQKNLANTFPPNSEGDSMRMLSILFTAFLSVAGATACSTLGSIGEDDYVVTSATPDAITLRFREGNLNKATERAAAHCAGSSRQAKTMNVMPSGDYSVAAFQCEY